MPRIIGLIVRLLIALLIILVGSFLYASSGISSDAEINPNDPSQLGTAVGLSLPTLLITLIPSGIVALLTRKPFVGISIGLVIATLMTQGAFDGLQLSRETGLKLGVINFGVTASIILLFSRGLLKYKGSKAKQRVILPVFLAFKNRIGVFLLGSTRLKNRYFLFVVLLLLLIAGWFYWFQWRPYQARKNCMEPEYVRSKITGQGGKLELPKNLKVSQLNALYRWCLAKHGLQPESLFEPASLLDE